MTLKRQEDLRAKGLTRRRIRTPRSGKRAEIGGAAEAAQVNLDYCYIKSPINGRVGLRNVDVGNFVGPGRRRVLVTIQGLDPIYTDFTVAETDLGSLGNISAAQM